MRWLFLFVLSLNLAYLGWYLTKSPQNALAEVTTLKNVQPIVLLSEVKAQSVTGAVMNSDIPVYNKLSEMPGKPEKTEKLPQLALAKSAEESGVVEKPVNAASATQNEIKPAEATVNSDSPVLGLVKTAESVPASVGPSVDQTANCFTLGPFRDLDKLRGLTRAIKPFVVSTDFRGSEEKEPTLHWVFLKPEKNNWQAIATGKRLKANKVKDFYIIREGEKIHGLSLGYFRNKNGAYGLAKKVTDLGFEVKVEPVIKTYTVYWLDYQLADNTVIPEKILDKHLVASEKNKPRRLSRDCVI